MITALTLITYCHAQTTDSNMRSYASDISMDIGSLIYDGMASFTFGHAFATKWTAYASLHLSLSSKGPDTSGEEFIHQAEFSDNVPSGYTPCRQAVEAGIRFWNVKAYEGVFFTLGYLSEESARSACSIGAGLCIPLYKGMNAEISYNKTIYHKDRMSDRLKVGVGLVF